MFLCWARRKPRRLALFCQHLCGTSYWWIRIDGQKSRCWLLWIVFVIDGDKSLKVLNCQCKLPDILFFRVAFPWDQIVEPWQLTCYWPFDKNRIVSNAINLVLFIIASFELVIQPRIIHLPFLYSILFQQLYVKHVVNPPFLGQFELINLFAYRI